MDSVVEVILNPLSLALDLHGFCWRSCPLWGEGVFRLAQPRYALSFPDSVSSGKDSGKLPRKSIQRYFAMYPRINRQVSSITLPSILASFFTRFHWTRFLSMYWTSSQHRESHTDSVVTSHFEKALRSDFTAGNNAGEPLSGQNTLAAETFRLSSPFFQIELVTLLNQGINSSETINYANKQGHAKREGSVGPICQIL